MVRKWVSVAVDYLNPGFINASLKLNRSAAEVQMSYEEAASKFERITSELPSAENMLRGIQTKFKSFNRSYGPKR